MATRVAIATGNFTAAGTWGLVDATSNLDAEAGPTASTTSFVYSATFTPGAITIDAIAVKVGSRTISPTGTVSIELNNSTDVVSVETVVINATDIADTSAAGTAYNRGWYVFKLAGTQLLIAGKAYKIGFKTSVSGTVSLYRNATAGNWARMLRTTTTGAPAVDDQLHICGEHTGAATGNNFTVTLDNTATTSFGPTVSATWLQGITVGKRGTFASSFSASAWYLKWKGMLHIGDGGVMTGGTLANPIDSAGSLTLEMHCIANVDTGISVDNGGSFTVYGASVTTPKTTMTLSRGGYCTTVGTAVTGLANGQSFVGLTGAIVINGVGFTISSVTDATHLTLTGTAGTQATPVIWTHAGTAATITVASTTGWVANDVIVLASTNLVPGDCEKLTIQTVDSSTQVTLTSGATKSHLGSAPWTAEVAHLTRNVKIKGTTILTLQGYITFAAFSSGTLYYAELERLGGLTNTGLLIANTNGSFDCQYCSRYDSTHANSVAFKSTNSTGGWTFSNNNIFNFGTAGWLSHTATTGVPIMDNNLFLLCTSSGATIGDNGLTFTNNTFVGTGSDNVTFSEIAALGTFSGNTFRCALTQSGLRFSGRIPPPVAGVGSTISSSTFWACTGNNGAMRFDSLCSGLLIDGLTMFYVNALGISFNGGVTASTVNNATFQDTTIIGVAGATYGIEVARIAGDVDDLKLTNCQFGQGSGLFQPILADIRVPTATGKATVTAYNCLHNGATSVLLFFGLSAGTADVNSEYRQMKFNQTAGDHRRLTFYGIEKSDTVIFDVTPASVRLTPLVATAAFQSARFTTPVISGATCTPTIKVRESAAGDAGGSTYNGQRAKLYVEANVAAGIASDTLLATATGASAGAWESISGATAAVTDDCVLSFYVTCGFTGWTTGWVNFDTGSVAVSNTSAGMRYWKDGLVSASLADAGIGTGGGGNSTYA